MEIKVNIPQNDYVEPTEVREEVIQAICDAFLSNSCWDIFTLSQEQITVADQLQNVSA